MEKLGRMKQMRDELMQGPELDMSKMSKKQRALLKLRDYDAFFLESIEEDGEAFAKQEEMFKRQEDIEAKKQEEKLKKRVE